MLVTSAPGSFQRSHMNFISRVLPHPVSPITITGMLHLNTIPPNKIHNTFTFALISRDVFEDNMVEAKAKAKAKAKARRLRGQGQGQRFSRPRPRPGIFEAKAKATKFCPRGVLEVEASPRGPPSLRFLPCDATQRAVMPRRLSVHHLKFNALLPPLVRLCMKYCRPMYGIESFTYNY